MEQKVQRFPIYPLPPHMGSLISFSQLSMNLKLLQKFKSLKKDTHNTDAYNYKDSFFFVTIVFAVFTNADTHVPNK